jgi:hypothetical protein
MDSASSSVKTSTRPNRTARWGSRNPQDGQFVASVPPSTSKTLPVTQLDAGEAR